MLTIKWIVNTQSGQIIRMYEARDVAVAYRNEPRPLGWGKGVCNTLKRWEVDGRPVEYGLLILDPQEANFSGRSFDCGTVYVMNETGATVGKYVLSEETELMDDPQPLFVPCDHLPIPMAAGPQ